MSDTKELLEEVEHEKKRLRLLRQYAIAKLEASIRWEESRYILLAPIVNAPVFVLLYLCYMLVQWLFS